MNDDPCPEREILTKKADELAGAWSELAGKLAELFELDDKQAAELAEWAEQAAKWAEQAAKLTERDAAGEERAVAWFELAGKLAECFELDDKRAAELAEWAEQAVKRLSKFSE